MDEEDSSVKVQLLSRAAESLTPPSKRNYLNKFLKNGSLLSTNWAAVLLCGEMLGASSLSLSHALQSTGFYNGMCIYVFINGVSAFYAYFLSKSYAELRPSIKESLNGRHLRDPYPQLVNFSINKVAKYIVIVSILFSDFLGTAALIVLPANLLVNSYNILLFPSMSAQRNLRIWMVLNAVLLIPFTWNDRLKDNKIVGFLSLSTAVLGNCLVLLMYFLTSGVKRTYHPVNSPSSHFNEVVTGIGILLTTVDGFDILPNLQEDMKNIHEYKKVILKGYTLFSMVMLPVMIGGYLYFHHKHKLSDNIIGELMRVQHALEGGWYKTTFHVLALMALTCFIVHIMSSTIIQLNPSFQYLETIFICPDGLSLKRIILRTSIIVVILVFVELVPLLLPLLSFNGTILFVVLGIIFPGIIYIRVFRDKVTIFKRFLILAITVLFCVFLSMNVFVNLKIIFKSAQQSLEG